MKKILVIVIAFTSVYIANTQSYSPFDTASISWNEMYESGDDGPDNISNLDYFILGDTLIQNQRYFKIFQASEYDTLYMGAFREANKLVFYVGIDYFGFDTDTTVLIYDFTKSIGDTVHKDFRRNIIVAIDSVQVFDRYRKRFILVNDEWIEGIGSTRGFLFPISNIPAMYWHSELVCFKHNEEVIYLNPGFSDCTTRLVTAVKDPRTTDDVEIYPNPAARGSQLFVKVKEAPINRIQLYNELGILVSAIDYRDKKEIVIDTKDFSPGAYVLLIFKSNQDVVKRKLVVK